MSPLRSTACLLALCLIGCGSGGSGTAPPTTPTPPANPPTNGGGAASSVTLSAHLLVDQFGYRSSDPKVAVIRNPHVGFDSADTFSPGATYQVRKATDGTVVFAGAISPWNAGAVQASSGDDGWWFDFSSVNASGTYFVYDVDKQVRSATFPVAAQPYTNVLKAAMRMYFYQRAGSSSGGGAKQPPYADQCWADTPAYVGPNQDTQAHDATDQGNASKVHDLSGGWFDAGDMNKYVTFATIPVHQLLSAYQENPAAFTDDFNIPESGNGIPDLIDEVKYETDWIKKMQYSADGSVALKVGSLGYPYADPPSSDTSPRFYVPSCTSATIAAAGMLAHAAYVYGAVPSLASEAADLKARAIKAWNNYQGTVPKQEQCDTGIVKAGNADRSAADQESESVAAAVWLFAVTNDQAYNTYLKGNYKSSTPYKDIGWSRYQPQQGKALLFYTTLPQADPTLKAGILADKLNDVNAGNQVYGLTPSDDLYRNYLHDDQYSWGSNQTRGNYGNTNVDVANYGIAVSSSTPFITRALETLHYFHGVNPFAKVYMTNMGPYGATSSVNALYHTWFWPGSKWADLKTSQCGPAPGYIPGGPNAQAVQNGVPASIAPPAGQPPQKSYKDWNGTATDTQASYAVNEPGIYYQSAYVELLAQFAH
ncbi:MAG: glycoside hydrolase, family 9 [Gammaproteobacteria bacterium]|nr:glycoside hydrolase, family 9 [Gammaproteobacteria bacterium]